MRPIDLLVPAGIDDPRHPSGGNRYDRELATALAADGWSVRVIEVAGPDGRRPQADPRDRMRADATTVVDGLLLEDPDAVSPLLPSGGIPLLHMPPSDRPGVLDLVAGARGVITTSASTREHLLDLLAGRRVPPVAVALPGVGRVRAVEVSPGGRRLRCVAALLPDKGQDVLLAALGRLQDLDWRLELVGADDLDPHYTAALHHQATRLGIRDRVVCTGAWNPDPLARLYEGCDVLVLPSRVEGYGMVIAEAIGCGVPVIASDTDGTREALGGTRSTRSSRPGLLVRPGDPGELARALRRWLCSRGLRLDLTGAAKARSAHRRTWTSTARTVADALERAGSPAEQASRVTR